MIGTGNTPPSGTPASAGVQRPEAASATPDERSIPESVFRDFLRRLHAGPPQDAAAVKVALAVWETAMKRGDPVGAQAALEMVRGEMNRLVATISELQEYGRSLLSPTASDESSIPEAAGHDGADGTSAAVHGARYQDNR